MERDHEQLDKWSDCWNYLKDFGTHSSGKVLQKRLFDFFMAREGDLITSAIYAATEEMMPPLLEKQEQIQSLLSAAVQNLQSAMEQSSCHRDQVAGVIAQIKKANDLTTLEDLKNVMLQIGDRYLQELDDNQNKINQTMGDYRLKMDSLTKELDILTEKASKDPLNGVFSRSLLEYDLESHIGAAKGRKQGLGMVALNLIGLRQINNQFGADAQQRVVSDFIAILQDNLRRNDIIYSYDEAIYVILLPRCTESTGEQLTSRVQMFLNSHAYKFGSQSLKLNVNSYFNLYDMQESAKEFLARTLLLMD